MKVKDDSINLPSLILLVLLFFLVLFYGGHTRALSEESLTPKKFKVHAPEKVSKGYTVIPLVGMAKVLLIDIDGKLINQWEIDAVRARLLPNGNLLAIHGSKWGRGNEPWRSLRTKIVEYDWVGKKVWEYDAKDIVHHDLYRLENGNTLFLERDLLPKKFNSVIKNPKLRKFTIRSDVIREVTPAGKVAWQWRAHEHLDLNSCGRRGGRESDCLAYLQPKLKWHDWTHTNTCAVIPENKWYDQGHKQFKPGNISIMPRNLWKAMIIAREGGKVVWEYGGKYKGGLSASHEVHMIPKGLPGAGNILIFDNGVVVHDGESYILEINPVTNKIVWVYDKGKRFYSRRRGAVQRLPNGNTLISEDQKNRCFEVTPEKEIIWLYKAKYPINRCYRYPEGYLSRS